MLQGSSYLELSNFIDGGEVVININIVGRVEPEYTFIARQRLGKQIFVAKNGQATIEELLGTVYPIRSVHIDYEEEFS
jgi:hypothetical protein